MFNIDMLSSILIALIALGSVPTLLLSVFLNKAVAVLPHALEYLKFIS